MLTHIQTETPIEYEYRFVSSYNLLKNWIRKWRKTNRFKMVFANPFVTFQSNTLHSPRMAKPKVFANGWVGNWNWNEMSLKIIAGQSILHTLGRWCEKKRGREADLVEPLQRQDIYLRDSLPLSEILTLCNSLNISVSEYGIGLLTQRQKHPAVGTLTQHIHSASCLPVRFPLFFCFFAVSLLFFFLFLISWRE